MNLSTRETLALFEEKASKLTRSSFLKELSTKPIEVKYQRGSDDKFTVNKMFPDAEMLDAFVLTFRMLIQNNDSISIGNLGKLTTDNGLSKKFRELLDAFRDELNSYLDTPGLLEGFSEMGLTTRRALLHTFIYGEMAHTGKERPVYLKLKADHLFPVVEFMFLKTVGDVMLRIEWLLEIVRTELSGQPIPLWIGSFKAPPGAAA